MAINKVIYGNDVLIDLTADTITASDLASGVTAHDASGTGYVYTNLYIFQFLVDEVAKVSANNNFSVNSGRDDQPHSVARHYTVTLTNLAATTQLRFYVYYNPGGEWWDGTCAGRATVTVTGVS